jgi:hypothetical protein
VIFNFIIDVGNKLRGTISNELARVSSSLANLTLSNNKLTGSIPLWVQHHSFLELDLSNNRFDGTLTSDFNIASNQVSLELSVNRLSGNLPQSIIQSTAYSSNLSSLDVLTGNIFDCNNDDLPALDPSAGSYSCGSYELNVASYIWFVCVGIAAVITFLLATLAQLNVYFSARIVEPVVNRLKEWRQSLFDAFSNGHNNQFNQLMETQSFVMFASFVSRIVLIFGAIIFVLGTTVYASLHSSYAIVSNDYGYVISCAYLHGPAPVFFDGILLSMLLSILLFLSKCFYNPLSAASRRRNGSPVNLSEEETHSWISHLFEKRVFTWTAYRNYAVFLVLNLINLVVVMAVNIAYVGSLRSSTSDTRKLMIQVSVGLFKVVWNTCFVSWSSDWISTFLSHRGSMQSRYIMSLVNFILAPVISTVVYSESCFYYVFNDAVEVSSSYLLDVVFITTCSTGGGNCIQTTSINIDSSTSTAFVYSYACGAALIVAYTPVMLTSSLIYGLFQQLLRILSVYDNFFSRIVFQVSYSFMVAVSKEKVPYDASGIGKARMKGRDAAIRFMTHLTIILTFGLASPILIVPLCFAITMDITVCRLLIGKMLNLNHNPHISHPSVKELTASVTNMNPMNEKNDTDTATSTVQSSNLSTVAAARKDEAVVMNADVLILEHLDMRSSWLAMEHSLYLMIIITNLFWSLLFFDMIADGYGLISGVILTLCFATMPSLILISMGQSNAISIISKRFGSSGRTNSMISWMCGGNSRITNDRMHEQVGIESLFHEDANIDGDISLQAVTQP